MRLRDLIQNRTGVYLPENEYAENITVDWNQLKAALTVIATDPDLKGVKPVDAIMFLGIIGDPKADPLDAKLKGPARFGVFTDKGAEFAAGNQGEYIPQGSVKKDATGKLVTFSEYDILINPEYWKALKADEDTPELVAHEARHRGFDIIFRNSQTYAKIPPQLRKYHEAGDWPQNWKPEDYWDSWEHMCLWSLERRGRSGFGPGYYFKNKQEMLQFRQWYYQLEAIAKAYVATLQVPSGGYEALRKEIDARTPEQVKIQVKPDAEGKPIVTGITPKVTKKSPNAPGGQSLQPSSSDAVIVKSGDSLSKIAMRMGVGLQDLIKANPQIKNPNLIYPGDEVMIP